MSAISINTGLISGLNTTEIVDALIAVQRNGAARMERQGQVYQARQAALTTLQAALLPLMTNSSQLGLSTTFRNVKVSNSDPAQLSVATTSAASPGDYTFRTVRTAQTDEFISSGAANADTQTFGTGQLVISSAGGLLGKSTSLNMLNGGDGVRRGSIRITDRSGASAVIDLTSAVEVEDVLRAINENSAISVTATSEDGRLVLTDTSGSTSANLSVAEVGAGRTAQDLGLLGSVASDSLDGAEVFQVTGEFGLNLLNDGNGIRRVSGDDLKITLTDDTILSIDLDGATTIDDVLSKINDHADNGGKLAASFANGRFVLTDQSGGGGTAAFTVENIEGASVVHELGLDTAEAGGTVTGRRVVAGISSVLLANLRGGRGIDQVGQLSLTDRAGNQATIDLAGAESLDEVLNAINAATTAGDVKLGITARINTQGTGIEIVDTTGATASNLVIADVGGSTLAEQLGIETAAAVATVDSGSLALRHVNEATSLSTYRLNGGSVRAGTFRITNSAGAEAVVTVSSSDKTIGDILKKINDAGLQVTAQLNQTGDGIVLTDDAGGLGALTIADVSGTAGSDLRLVGTGTVNGDGKSEINARRAVVIDVAAEDTLNTIRNKINLVGGFATASVVSTGNPIKPVRLLLRASQSGADSRLVVDDGGLGFGFSRRVEGKDAVLQVGQDAAGSTFLTSRTNTFTGVNAGVNVTVIAATDTTASVTLARDDSQIETTLKTFVTTYNTYLTAYKEATKFDFEAGARGVLQGDSFSLRLQAKFDSILGSRSATGTSVRSLQDVGIALGTDGKLSLDSERLSEALTDNRADVIDFFQKPTTGFAARLTSTLDTLTNTTDGAFKNENDTLQTTIDALASRIADIDATLAIRRERLLLRFAKMEQALSSLQGSQSVLSNLQALARPQQTR